MPWQEETVMSLRQDFVRLAQTQTIALSELCRRFGISRKTGYKWLARAKAQVPLADRSRVPHTSPTRTSEPVIQRIIALRMAHPAWGGRKIARVLHDQGHHAIPAPSTITHILHRAGLIAPRTTGEGAVYQRFEHPAPNSLWQMDFKGYFPTQHSRCEPLTVLDDHSRYNVVLQALSSTHTLPVKHTLTQAFRLHGLPQQMNMDNGQPWGSPRAGTHGLSQLSVWLIRLGIHVSFSRPAHPQTNGKDERFHRTLKAEVLQGRVFRDLSHVQHAFDDWRSIYNHVRPHEALDLAVPASRYQPSARPFPEVLPAIVYSPDDVVVRVKSNGDVRFKQHHLKVSKALRDLPIAFRPDYEQDGRYQLYFCHHRFDTLDLKSMPTDA